MKRNSIVAGDCREVLASMEAESVQMVVTSPPYWGLRAYSGDQEMVWGGPEGCGHRWGGPVVRVRDKRNIGSSDGLVGRAVVAPEMGQSSFCTLCGAWRGAYGMEPTIDLYCQHTIEILRAIRRVLRPDGTIFWNIGDSYNGSGGAGGDYAKGGLREGQPKYPGRNADGLKPKDLCLIPFRVALAAQADGWWVRSVIVWDKPNPMPESVTDRPTNSHEYILLLTKAARYFYDADAVREPVQDIPINRKTLIYDPTRPRAGFDTGRKERFGENDAGKQAGFTGRWCNPSGRNLRSVWRFPTAPYPEAHFATFPPELPRRCILAGSGSRACSKCGKSFTTSARKATLLHDEKLNTPQQNTLQAELRPMRKILRGTRADSVQSEVRSTSRRYEKTQTTEELRAVRNSFQAPEPTLEEGPFLHPEVQHNLADRERSLADTSACKGRDASAELQGGESGRRRLPSDIQRRASLGAGQEEEICPGASVSNGGAIGPTVAEKRICASQKRNQDRQPAREPGGDDEESAQGARDMSPLRQDLRDTLSPCCNAPYRPALVLDPFMGAGTTGLVAAQLGRDFIGIDASAEYVAMAEKRIAPQLAKLHLLCD